MKYRKKPIEVDAKQLTEENAKELAEWCESRCEYWMINPPKFGCVHLYTSSGVMYATVGDWIVKSEGEFYSVKKDIFEKTYEKAEESDV